MSISMKVPVPQINPALKALQLSSLMPNQNDTALPSRTTFMAVSMLPVYIFHSEESDPAQFPTVADVLGMGMPCTATAPVILQTADIDSPQRTNGAQIFVAVATGATPGDLRVMG